MSEIDRFRLVLAVARARSISDVAQRTGLSQPTVTRAVAATERLAGFPLRRDRPQTSILAARASRSASPPGRATSCTPSPRKGTVIAGQPTRFHSGGNGA
ncbi:helix-turn-helix domain-containing protein [Tsukamurella ocularis]|uniref:helix-turn-helix domain-containing protein n=1 Tax=Tsukamurella ocularis TaxID=1970234 RepID=UPI0039EEC286